MSGGKAKKTQAGQVAPEKGERIAKVMARAGLCSRREAETWIAAGRVALNGKVLATPAVTVTDKDRILVDGQPLAARERSRLFLFHKPRGLVSTQRDPEGRPTVFSALPEELPRLVSIGRLDINTEGLLLLTNDGGLARILELPSTGWLRRYRVRAHGRIDQERLDALKRGIAVEGMLYGPIEAVLERQQGDNAWLLLGLREGKNREVKKVLEHLGLAVNRLIRISYGPFQLGDLAVGAVKEVPARTLRDQLGPRLIEASGADLEAPVREAETAISEAPKRPGPKAAEKPGQKKRMPRPHRAGEKPGGARKPGGPAAKGRTEMARPETGRAETGRKGPGRGASGKAEKGRHANRRRKA
ncbi:pseudouridine synthase [Afifella sp. IM 167]|uniref:pseudouridine synthase n=1 Tax=Afifella sp. IM 167 TaxID=2033586 RepID=UPI001CCFB89E|nr:pseudouridine synthase [Afifella sp. IM 167]MBZ8133476.1 pseudouridine synthase [Afifella sp. IM 167]